MRTVFVESEIQSIRGDPNRRQILVRREQLRGKNNWVPVAEGLCDGVMSKGDPTTEFDAALCEVRGKFDTSKWRWFNNPLFVFLNLVPIFVEEVQA